MTTDTAPAAPAPTTQEDAFQLLQASELTSWEMHYVLGRLSVSAPAEVVEAIHAAKAHTKAGIL